VSRLKALAGVQRCTLYQVVLGLWALLLCRHAGQDEVVIGSPYHGRDVDGTKGLIGYFVNVLPLRLRAPRGSSVGDLLRCARTAALDGMRHAAVPFQRMVHELLPKRTYDASRNAVFQAMLSWEEGGGLDAAEASAHAFGEGLRVEPASTG
jgi:non-ribosomal peptide synthetase component F